MKAKKQPFWQPRKWIESEREAIRDYLHGHIPDDEVKAAASYEFARESTSFLYAAAMFRKGAENEICAPDEWPKGLASVTAGAKGRPDDFDFLIMQFPERTIWSCPQFPRFPWTELTPPEKKDIQRHFGPGALSPFNTLDAELLTAMKVIEKLQSLAEKTRKERESASFHKQHSIRKNPILAAVRGDQQPWVEHIVCTLNYRGGKDALVNAFGVWLDSNRTKYFDDYYEPPIQRDSEHSLRRYCEALKNLTAARLYATLGLSEAKRWTRENRKRENGVVSLAYFGQKMRKQRKGGPLFEERRQWEKAVGKVYSCVEILLGFGLILE
jgi:hypothetical protein